MTRMRVRRLTSCRDHRRAIIVLEDVGRHLALTCYADPDDARPLARKLDRGRKARSGANVAIFASPGALDHGKPARGPDAAGHVVGWLERLRPEDFG